MAAIGPSPTKKRRTEAPGVSEEDKVPKIGTASGVQRRAPIYVEDDAGYPLSRFVIPGHYKPYVETVVLPHGVMLDRVERLAADIREDYGSRTPHFLCVLKGAAEFFNDLSKFLRRFHEYFPSADAPYTFDFIRVKSYHNDKSTGNVKVIGADLKTLRGRDVIVVEDIIDSGLTMQRLMPLIRAAGATSVRVASLLEKRTTRSCGFVGDYIGFSVPDLFIVGYNMDYNEVYRDLRHLCVISKAGLEKYREVPMSPTPKAKRTPSKSFDESVGDGASAITKLALPGPATTASGAGGAGAGAKQ